MRYLYVGATAEVEREVFETVRDRVAAAFAAPVKEIELPAVDFAYDPGRRQYASIPLLEMLQRLCPADAWKLVAVTGRDLFIPVLTFVFGHAQLGGRLAVISLARLRQEFYGLAPNREVLFDRAYKEALHETGHTLGLVHCADRNCVMSLATNVRQIDSRNGAYCAVCAARVKRGKRE
ncbi:MAG TPA: archaemetzincin [Bryobacteraceae bacterium]|nr:archaemetzincin [Bryobacteraceae bacterium]